MKPRPVETFDVTLKRPWPVEGLNIAAMPPEAMIARYSTTMVGGGVFQIREQIRSITLDAETLGDNRPIRPINVLWRLYVNKQLVSEGVGSSGLFLDALPGDRVQLFVKVPPETKRVVASLNGFEIPASVA